MGLKISITVVYKRHSEWYSMKTFQCNVTDEKEKVQKYVCGYGYGFSDFFKAVKVTITQKNPAYGYNRLLVLTLWFSNRKRLFNPSETRNRNRKFQ